MADQALTKPVPALGTRDLELLVFALQSLKAGDIEIDYDVFQTKGEFKTRKAANNKWLEIKKKLFAGVTAPSATAGGSSKVTKSKAPQTPTTPKETKEAKTPTTKSKKTFKSEATVTEDDDSTSFKEVVPNGDKDVKVEEEESDKVQGDGELSDDADGDANKDADGDLLMPDTPSTGNGKAQKPVESVADDLSGGEMSPAPIAEGKKAATKPKAAATPKPKAAPKAPLTPKTPGTDGSQTPASTGAKKRGRKTKAQKEAEAAIAGAAGEDAAETDEGDNGEKPAKKPRMTPVKTAAMKVKKEDKAEAEDGEGEAEKSVKKPRKTPVKKPKKEEAVENGDAAEEGEAEESQVKIGEVPKEKKKPGPKSGSKPAAAKANVKKALATAKPIEEEDPTEEEKVAAEAAAKITQEADEANAVLNGKKIETKTASTATTVVHAPGWGTSVNGTEEVKDGGAKANGVVDDETIVVETVLRSVEKDDEGDSILVNNASG